MCDGIERRGGEVIFMKEERGICGYVGGVVGGIQEGL